MQGFKQRYDRQEWTSGNYILEGLSVRLGGTKQTEDVKFLLKHWFDLNENIFSVGLYSVTGGGKRTKSNP